MFHALDIAASDEVLSLDVDPNLPPLGHREIGDERPYDSREVTWREWCAAGRLVCRGCRAPVVFRRGRWRVAHFAHRAATTCRHARTTDAERMAAVAALYAWLRSKCGRDGGPLAASTLTVEHWPTQPPTRSPIDVHVAGAAASSATSYSTGCCASAIVTPGARSYGRARHCGT